MDKKYAVVIDCSGEVKTIELESSTEGYEWFDEAKKKADIEFADQLPFPYDKHYDCYYDTKASERELPVNQKATDLFNLGYSVTGNILIIYFNGYDDSEPLTEDQVKSLLDIIWLNTKSE